LLRFEIEIEIALTAEQHQNIFEIIRDMWAAFGASLARQCRKTSNNVGIIVSAIRYCAPLRNDK
jgi:hypothetical protein